MEEVEEIFGITLLKSSKTTEKPVPHVNIFAINHGGYIEVDDTHYYLYNRVITDLSEHGATTHDNIRYELSIWGIGRAEVLEEYLETLI